MFTQKTNSFQQFQKDLRNCNVYGALVLHGEEEFIINWAIEMIVKKFVSKATAMMDFVEFDEKEIEIERLEESCETLPMLSEKKVVLIRNYTNKYRDDIVDIISKIGENTVLIFTGKEIDKRIVDESRSYEFTRLENHQLMKFIEKRFRESDIDCNRSILKTIIAESGYYNDDIDYNLYNLVGDIKKIIESIGKNNIVDKIADMMNIDINNIDISGYVTKLIRSVMSSVGNILMGVISGISGFFNTIISVFMAVVFAIYILMDKERIAVQGDKLLRAFLPSKRDSVIDVLRIFNTSFRNYFISQVKEAIILGVLLYIVMIIARLPYASSISILVGVTALIPVIGAYAGLFVGTLMILTKSFSSMIIFIIVHTVVQQFENNIIYPRVVGSSVGLPGMWVIVAVALGGSLGGIFGVFVAVPVAASLYFILKRETLKRL